MKNKNFGDLNEEYSTGLNAEFLTVNDPVSARSINRPIINLYEDQEETYKLVNTLLKTVYGNASGIIPDTYETFAPEGFVIGSFSNDTSNYYLRIPTGMMLLSEKTKDISNLNNSNPFSKFGEYDYNDNLSTEHFINDVNHSFVFDNRPNINLLERQLANLIGLDLTDLTNDIKIEQVELPVSYKIAVIETENDQNNGYQKIAADGSPVFVNNGTNTLYLCSKDKAEYYVTNVEKNIVSVTYDGEPKGKNKIFNGHENVLNEDGEVIGTQEAKTTNQEDLINYYVYDYTLKDGTRKPGYEVVPISSKQIPEDFVYCTSDISNAIHPLDHNGDIKKQLAYCMTVVRSTSEDDEKVYLPNKSVNSNWKVCLPGFTTPNENNEYEHTYTIIVRNGNTVVEELSFSLLNSCSSTKVNNALFNTILTQSEKLTVEKFQFTDDKSDIGITSGVQIICKSNQTVCNNYDLTITSKLNKEEPVQVMDIYTDRYIAPVETDDGLDLFLPNKAITQRYYNNIFDLTNAFLGYFKSYSSNISNVYNYIAGETLIPMNASQATLVICYDKKFDTVNNKNNPNYDKTGRIYSYLSSNEPSDKDLVLFSITFDRSSSIPKQFAIKNIKYYKPVLDRRLISTKRAELNTLLSDTRTDLINYVNMKDNDGNRSFEMTEDSQTPDLEQIRIKSPITRITSIDKLSTEEPAWSDETGDNPSDFIDSFTFRNLETNETTDYYHDVNDDGEGLVINKNKGILLFENNNSKTSNHNKSNNKPIEIINKYGNINLINTNSQTSRIGIKNLEDSQKNIVDILGITRIRSKQNNQLVIRKIGDYDSHDGVNILFTQGNSLPNNNETAVDNDDLTIGKVSFYSGLDGSEAFKDENSEEKVLVGNSNYNNRFFALSLSDMPDDTQHQGFMSTALVVRNANSRNGKKIFSIYGDITPAKTSIQSLGLPIKSRTYFNDETTAGSYASQKKANLKVDEVTGTSTEYLNEEGRWLSAFVNYGYFNKITLADKKEDINNKDARDGNLRLGNGNIYDVSSIYINHDSDSTNVGTINFDNSYEISKDNKILNTENTIYSVSNEKEDTQLNIVLNRALEKAPNTNTETEKENNNGINIFKATLKGVEICKNAEVRRQMFVNNHKNSTTEDNSALVVKGQTVMNGELVIGKKAATVNTSNTDDVTMNTEKDVYKMYNTEYFANTNKDYNGIYVRDSELYMLRTYGRSYFEGDITLNPNNKFTDVTTFNKSIVINNNNYADKAFNQSNAGICPSDDPRFVEDNIYDNKYYTNTKKINRHNTAIDVVSGTIEFGTEGKIGSLDGSDLKLYGSQWNKRRLEIGTSSPVLFDTYMHDTEYGLSDDGAYAYKNSSSEREVKLSPSFYIKGASQFGGDVVFGGALTDGTYIDDEDEDETQYNYKYIKSRRNYSKDIDPIKAIFWGRDDSPVAYSDKVDYKTDFDFHGRTWFDSYVRIGCDPQTNYNLKNSSFEFDEFDELLQDTEEYKNNRGYGKLFIDGEPDETSFSMTGGFAIQKAGNSQISGTKLEIFNALNDSYANVVIDGSNDETLGGSINANAYKKVSLAADNSNSLTKLDNEGIALSVNTFNALNNTDDTEEKVFKSIVLKDDNNGDTTSYIKLTKSNINIDSNGIINIGNDDNDHAFININKQSKYTVTENNTTETRSINYNTSGTKTIENKLKTNTENVSLISTRYNENETSVSSNLSINENSVKIKAGFDNEDSSLEAGLISLNSYKVSINTGNYKTGTASISSGNVIIDSNTISLGPATGDASGSITNIKTETTAIFGSLCGCANNSLKEVYTPYGIRINDNNYFSGKDAITFKADNAIINQLKATTSTLTNIDNEKLETQNIIVKNSGGVPLATFNDGGLDLNVYNGSGLSISGVNNISASTGSFGSSVTIGSWVITVS